MAARLKRLEGMVREMLDEDGNIREPSSEHTAVGEDEDDSFRGGDGDDSDASSKLTPSVSGAQVVRGPGARGGTATYVGATHFMAMLGDVRAVVLLLIILMHRGPGNACPISDVVPREVQYQDGENNNRADAVYVSQIEDLKSYFDHEEVNEEMDGDSPEYFTDGDSPAMLIGSRAAPKTRQDLLDMLPPKHVADRLVMRYFNAHSASQRTQATPSYPHFPSRSQEER